MPENTKFTVCPRCGSRAVVKSTENPIRNVIRDHIKCPNCKFEQVVERAPDVTLADWLKAEK
ncbi:MAG: hypothetical protein HYU02_03630 [Thaumarchaeota archaeon]|nr:hypothetical protein [Nitrososphaerota archaeon]